MKKQSRTISESVDIFLSGARHIRASLKSGPMSVPREDVLNIADELNRLMILEATLELKNYELRDEVDSLKAQNSRLIAPRMNQTQTSYETTTTAAITHDAECGWVDTPAGRAWQDTGGVMHHPV